MLIEGLLVGSVISTFYNIDKSMKMDSQALQQYAEAYEIKALARRKLEEKSKETDCRLNNVVRKKRSVIEHSIPRFIEIYDVIQKVIVNSNLPELPELPKKAEVSYIKKTVNAKSLSDKELICTWLFRGIGRVAEKESERYLSASNIQLDYSKVYQSQTESVIEFYDSIIRQADLLSDTIAKMNCLLITSLPQIENIIRNNKEDIRNFSELEIGKMMVCVDLVCALTDLIGVPVVNKDGLLFEEGVKMVARGQDKLMQIESAINKL